MSASERIVEWLESLGFVEDGRTATQEVRIPTTRSPVFGRTGGERRTFGGRLRFRLPNTNIRATVGPRTVNVYVVTDGDTRFLLMSDTVDVTLDGLRKAISSEGQGT